MVRVAIFDYGVGNIFNLKSSLEKAGAQVDVINDLTGDYSGILLPGVGNFDPAMQKIHQSSTNIIQYTKDIPVLGICLGMEIFFENSDEGNEKGLGVMNGRVIPLVANKVPHMGWNNLHITKHSKFLEGIKDNSWVYFVHSFMVKPSDDIILANTDYNGTIPAIVQKDNYTGTQFHPEKSGETGKKMIKNFLDECKK